jgi:DNA replication protein DnaC
MEMANKKLEEIQAKSIGRQTVTYDTFCGKYCNVEWFDVQNGECSSPGKADDCPKMQNIFKSKLIQAGINKRYWPCNFKEIEHRGIHTQFAEQYEQIIDYCNNLSDNVNNGIGLILKGPVGTMKTTFAVAIIQEWIKLGYGGLFVPMASLLDNIFTLKAKNVEEWASYENKIRKTGLLILDDLGAEHTEGWVLTKVDAIISERYNRCGPIIITTNLSAEQLKKTYAERIVDRLRSTSKTITFSGKSLRGKA